MGVAILVGLLVKVLLFWLLVVRPASKRQRQVRELQDSLQVGQRVMLASGIYGTITGLTDDRATLAIAEGVEVEVVRGAVSSVEPQDDSPAGGPVEGPGGDQP